MRRRIIIHSVMAVLVMSLAAVDIAGVHCYILPGNNSKQQRHLEHAAPPENALSRRHLFQKTFRAMVSTAPVLATAVVSPPSVSAEEIASTTQAARGDKPYAPVEALLPATRCKAWIDRAYGMSCRLSLHLEDNKDQKDDAFRILKELDGTLSSMPPLFGANEKRKTSTNNLGATVGQITASVSSANKSQYQQNRKDLSVPDKLQAMFNQADVERQWGMLQYAESNRERDNPVRAALNAYTQQLTFGDSYLLTASREDKKRMVRSDSLPSLTAVITSDLDLRDLYRNQLLTAIDDARAEVAYQVKQTPAEVDLADAVFLVNQAHVACDKWFGLIPEADVQEALKRVSNENP